MPSLTTPIQHSIGNSSHKNHTGKINKRHSNWKGGNETVTVCRWHGSVYRNPVDTTKKLLDIIREFGKTAGYKVNIQKSKAFLYTNNEISETEIRGKNLIYYSNKINKVPRNKLIQGGKRPVHRKLHNTEERNQGRHKQMEACTMLMDWKN